MSVEEVIVEIITIAITTTDVVMRSQDLEAGKDPLIIIIIRANSLVIGTKRRRTSIVGVAHRIVLILQAAVQVKIEDVIEGGVEAEEMMVVPG